MDEFLRLVTVLLIFVFVLVITHFVTKFVGNYQKNQFVGKGIEVLDVVRISANIYIQIVRVANRILVLAVGKDNTTLLCELSREEYEEFKNNEGLEGSQSSDAFKEMLEKAKTRLHFK